MDRITFYWILECALLRWDGVTKEKMIELGAESEDADSGIKLCDYLKSIKLKHELRNDNQ